jgi:hypothetical protein
MHVLALTQDKRAVYSWGSNRHGQLGRGTETDTESVGIIEALEGETIGNNPSTPTPHNCFFNYLFICLFVDYSLLTVLVSLLSLSLSNSGHCVRHSQQ